MTRRRWTTNPIGAAVVLLGLVVIVGWPLASIVLAAVAWLGAVPTRGLLDPLFTSDVVRPLGLAITTLKVAVTAVALALPLGVALAVLLVRTDLWGRRVLGGLVVLGLFIPLPLLATAWLNAIGNQGRAQAIGTRPILVGWIGAAVIHAIAALPWVVVIMGAGLRLVERELEESALLDLPAWKVVLRVSLRRCLGALAASALTVAVLTAGDMTVTDLLAVRTYAEEAFVQFQFRGGPITAARVALPPLLLLGSLIALVGRGLMRSEPARVVSSGVRPRIWRLGLGRVPLGLAVWGAAGLLLAVPIGGLLWRAGRVGGRAALGQPPRWSVNGVLGTLSRAWPDLVEVSALSRLPMSSPILATSLCAALAATFVAALSFGLACAGRRSRRWDWMTLGVVAVTLATPAPVTGMAIKLAYFKIPIIHDTPVIVVLALAARVLPYAIVLLWLAVRAIPQPYFDVAAVEGLGPFAQGFRVALPLAASAVAAAWGMAFVMALSELPASNLVLPPGVMTISLKVWSLLHNGVESHLAGLGLVLIGVYGVAGFVASRLLARVVAGAD